MRQNPTRPAYYIARRRTIDWFTRLILILACFAIIYGIARIFASVAPLDWMYNEELNRAHNQKLKGTE